MPYNHTSVLIKPASSLCNLNCDYCFYKEEAKSRRKACLPVMEERTIRNLLKEFLPKTRILSICFQGGEPTMAGLKWFENFVSIEKELNPKNKTRVDYSIQTNGTLIDESWCDFLWKNKFLAGVSFDGFPALNDLHRGKSGRRVLSAIRLMQNKGVLFNVLCVVTEETALNAPQVWDFFMRNQLFFLQFIPCMDTQKDRENGFLDPVSYGKFLCFMAENWYERLFSSQPVMIRLFENFVGILITGYAEQCGVSGVCRSQYAVESDGSVYPCDFYCTDEYLLGNVNENTMEELDQKREDLGFIKSSYTKIKECEDCYLLPLCGGGCRRNRKADGRFRFCESYKMLFEKEKKLFINAARMQRGMKLLKV